MKKIDPKHLDLINKAFAKLSVNGPYERRSTQLSFGKMKAMEELINWLLKYSPDALNSIRGQNHIKKIAYLTEQINESKETESHQLEVTDEEIEAWAWNVEHLMGDDGLTPDEIAERRIGRDEGAKWIYKRLTGK